MALSKDFDTCELSFKIVSHSEEALAETVKLYPFYMINRCIIIKLAIIKLASKKSRFKAAMFSQLCLYLITFISELISLTDVWPRISFVRYYGNFFANANVTFRKLSTKLPRRLHKILVHVNMRFRKLSTRIRRLSRYVFVHVN